MFIHQNTVFSVITIAYKILNKKPMHSNNYEIYLCSSCMLSSFWRVVLQKGVLRRRVSKQEHQGILGHSIEMLYRIHFQGTVVIYEFYFIHSQLSAAYSWLLFMYLLFYSWNEMKCNLRTITLYVIFSFRLTIHISIITFSAWRYRPDAES